jgi:hypothetical protein
VDVARYVAWLGLRGTVAADSLQPYLSAVNRFLTDHALPPVALGPLVSGVRKGLANSQEDIAPLPERLALPAQVVLDVLRLAETLLDMGLHRADPQASLLRAAVATIATYTFFNRGECGTAALTGDLVVTKAHITLLLREEKGRKDVRAGHRNSRQISVHDAPRVARVLGRFLTQQGSKAARSRLWALTPAEKEERWSAETMTGWLRAAYTAVNHQPPPGFSWTSHSLRKGAASASYALGARLTSIRYMGGWSTTSTVLESKYIDFAMRPSAAARLFFGYLL